MIKTILVPTGGSDTDLVVFETALAIAQLFSAHLGPRAGFPVSLTSMSTSRVGAR
jgi:hypothetical protein